MDSDLVEVVIAADVIRRECVFTTFTGSDVMRSYDWAERADSYFGVEQRGASRPPTSHELGCVGWRGANPRG